jgi:hypothetical protein
MHDDLISDEAAIPQYAAIGYELPPELYHRLMELHGKTCCNAWSEGQWCCVDYLLGLVRPDGTGAIQSGTSITGTRTP